MSFPSKKALSQRFSSCRGVGHGINAGSVDFADLRANPVGIWEDAAIVSRLIDDACGADGWLIFYTHDVIDRPSPYGCTPALLEAIVAAAAARCAVLPVRDVVAGLGVARPGDLLARPQPCQGGNS